MPPQPPQAQHVEQHVVVARVDDRGRRARAAGESRRGRGWPASRRRCSRSRRGRPAPRATGSRRSARGCCRRPRAGRGRATARKCCQQSALRRLVVVGGDDRTASTPAASARARELDAVPVSLVPVPAITVPRPPTRADDGAEQGDLLVVGQGRRLASRAGDDEAVRAVLEQLAGEPGQAPAWSTARSASNGVTMAVRMVPRFPHAALPCSRRSPSV